MNDRRSSQYAFLYNLYDNSDVGELLAYVNQLIRTANEQNDFHTATQLNRIKHSIEANTLPKKLIKRTFAKLDKYKSVLVKSR